MRMEEISMQNNNKYSLIGFVYNKNSSYPYQQIEVINIPNMSFDSLEDIDSYTCNPTMTIFKQKLPDKFQNKNAFAIQVVDRLTQEAYFIKPIFDQSELKILLNSIVKKEGFIDEQEKELSIIPEILLVEESWKKVQTAIKNRNLALLEEYFSNNRSYYSKLSNYIHKEHGHSDMKKDLEALKSEFRDYPIFRNAFVAQNCYDESNNIAIFPSKQQENSIPEYSYKTSYKTPRNTSNQVKKLVKR